MNECWTRDRELTSLKVRLMDFSGLEDTVTLEDAHLMTEQARGVRSRHPVPWGPLSVEHWFSFQLLQNSQVDPEWRSEPPLKAVIGSMPTQGSSQRKSGAQVGRATYES